MATDRVHFCSTGLCIWLYHTGCNSRIATLIPQDPSFKLTRPFLIEIAKFFKNEKGIFALMFFEVLRLQADRNFTQYTRQKNEIKDFLYQDLKYSEVIFYTFFVCFSNAQFVML